MAEKRMFSKKIIDTDWFMDMPASTQNLYFHLSMRADDDGFVSSPKRIIKLIGATDDDYKILIAKKFIIPFDSGVCVITDWRINNYLRSDRYIETVYKEEKATLIENENGKYELGIPTVYPVYTYSISNSNSISNNIIEKENKTKEKEEKHKYGEYGWIKLTDTQYNKLCEEHTKDYIDFAIQKIDEYIQSNGNKNKYKDWNLVLRKAIRDNWSCLNDKDKTTTNKPKREIDIEKEKQYGGLVI